METEEIFALGVAGMAALLNWVVPVNDYGTVSQTCDLCNSGIGILGKALNPNLMEQCNQVESISWLLIIIMVAAIGYVAYRRMV